MKEFSKTIAAISTGSNQSAVGMVRLSGSDAFSIADKVFKSKSGKTIASAKGYTALFGEVCDTDGVFDTAVALVFRAPKSYTGEDVVEITVHGGFYLTQRLLKAVISAGAAMASAGEFTKRAFLNSKISLSQAEAVASLISAKGYEEAKAALNVSEGRLNRQTEEIKQKIVTLLGQIAAYCDYPDEDIVDVSRETLLKELSNVQSVLDAMISEFDKGRVIANGVDTAIVGGTNVGKSTIMNILSGFEKSIVTDIAGTTRDIVEDTVRVGDFTLRLSDTAGIRETADTVEAAGVERAKKKIESAALVIAVFDSSRELTQGDMALIENLKGKKTLAVINKDDLENKIDEAIITQSFENTIRISSIEESGAKALEKAICDVLSQYKLSEDSALIINRRQYDCALRASNELAAAISGLEKGQFADMIGINLEEALRDLSELSGESATEAVVNEIFSKFCVGK